MEFSAKATDDKDLIVTIKLSSDDLEKMTAAQAKDVHTLGTDYCVTCRDTLGKEYKSTINANGDVDANIQAAATCFKLVGNPSYGLRAGRC